MVSRRILDSIKRRKADFLTETVEIQRPVTSTNDDNQPVTSLQTVTVVSGRVITAGQQQQSRATETASRQSQDQRVRVAVTAGTDVRVGDRLLVGERVYDVLDILDDRTDETDVQALCKRIRS